jgi:hypothetical protein
MEKKRKNNKIDDDVDETFFFKKRQRNEEYETKQSNLFEFVTNLFECKPKLSVENLINDFEIYKENERDFLETVSSDVLSQSVSLSSDITQSESSSHDLPKIIFTSSDFLEPEIPFPSTIIINITTHGKILCEEIGKQEHEPNVYEHFYTPITTTIPDEIEVIKFTLSMEGLPTFSLGPETNYYLSIINHYIDDLLKPDSSYDDFKILIDSFKIIANNLEEIAQTDIENEEKETGEIDYRGREFLTHYTKGYNIFKLESGDEIANKIFCRNSKNHNDFAITELTKKINTSKLRKYSICGAEYNNLPELPDLLSRTNSSIQGESKQIISLENIINYYKKFGVKKLIIFDFTCSIFSFNEDNNNYGLNEGEIKFVSELMCDDFICRTTKFNKLPYGGKNKNKNKSRKNKNKSRKINYKNKSRKINYKNKSRKIKNKNKL